MLFSTILVIAVSSVTVSSSFYDNPEQDPILPPGPDSANELHRKWDFEVLCRALYFRSLPLPTDR